MQPPQGTKKLVGGVLWHYPQQSAGCERNERLHWLVLYQSGPGAQCFQREFECQPTVALAESTARQIAELPRSRFLPMRGDEVRRVSRDFCNCALPSFKLANNVGRYATAIHAIARQLA